MGRLDVHELWTCELQEQEKISKCSTWTCSHNAFSQIHLVSPRWGGGGNSEMFCIKIIRWKGWILNIPKCYFSLASLLCDIGASTSHPLTSCPLPWVLVHANRYACALVTVDRIAWAKTMTTDKRSPRVTSYFYGTLSDCFFFITKNPHCRSTVHYENP